MMNKLFADKCICFQILQSRNDQCVKWLVESGTISSTYIVIAHFYVNYLLPFQIAVA